MPDAPERVRAVLNVNVILSALMRPEGPPGRVLHRFTESAFELVLSDAIVDELGRAAAYPKVRKRVPLTDAELDLWIASAALLAVHVEPRTVPAVVSADPDDDIYVAAALEGLARYIVSGDTHLLELGRHEDVLIVTPRAFLDRL